MASITNIPTIKIAPKAVTKETYPSFPKKLLREQPRNLQRFHNPLFLKLAKSKSTSPAVRLSILNRLFDACLNLNQMRR